MMSAYSPSIHPIQTIFHLIWFAEGPPTTFLNGLIRGLFCFRPEYNVLSHARRDRGSSLCRHVTFGTLLSSVTLRSCWELTSSVFNTSDPVRPLLVERKFVWARHHFAFVEKRQNLSRDNNDPQNLTKRGITGDASKMHSWIPWKSHGLCMMKM